MFFHRQDEKTTRKESGYIAYFFAEKININGLNEISEQKKYMWHNISVNIFCHGANRNCKNFYWKQMVSSLVKFIFVCVNIYIFYSLIRWIIAKKNVNIIKKF